MPCFTTRLGAVVMAHGDANGLMLPPAIAPYQVVIVPIPPRKDDSEEQAANVSRVAETLAETLRGADVRCKLDNRREVSPGWKFNHWERKGVPLRIDIGASAASTVISISQLCL